MTGFTIPGTLRPSPKKAADFLEVHKHLDRTSMVRPKSVKEKDLGIRGWLTGPGRRSSGVRGLKDQALDRHRIAVLPFANISPDPQDEYFADGLTEELIGKLSRLRGVEVIARTSVMTFKKQEKKVFDIANELGAGTIVEGSVRKSGNRIRVTVRLVNADSESQVWASDYERNLDDLFTIQGEIASKVAESIPAGISTAGPNLPGGETRDVTAYTFFLRGRELLREGSEPSLRRAVSFLEKAVEVDPGFARAYSEMAACYLRLGNMGYEPTDQALGRAKGPLTRALDLDPNLAEPHAALSWVRFNEDDHQGAEAEARKSIELNPSLPEGYDALSNLVVLKGDIDQSVRLCETCYRLDPLRSRYVVQLGRAYFYAGRESEALEHWKNTQQLSPAGTYRIMAEYYLSKNNLEKAKELHSMAEKLEPSNPWVVWMRGFLAAHMGDKDGALLAIRGIEQLGVGPIGLNYAGYVHYALGDLDAYFECMNRAADLHVIITIYPMYSPLLAKGRFDPRYKSLQQKFWHSYRTR